MSMESVSAGKSAAPVAPKASDAAAARKAAKAREKELINKTRPFAQENVALSWFHVVTTMLVIAAFITGTVMLSQWWARALCSLGAGLTLSLIHI